VATAARLYLRLYCEFRSGDAAAAVATREALLPFVKWAFARKNPIPLGTLFNSPLFQPLCDMARTTDGEKDVADMLSWAASAAPSLSRWR